MRKNNGKKELQKVDKNPTLERPKVDKGSSAVAQGSGFIAEGVPIRGKKGMEDRGL